MWRGIFFLHSEFWTPIWETKHGPKCHLSSLSQIHPHPCQLQPANQTTCTSEHPGRARVGRTQDAAASRPRGTLEVHGKAIMGCRCSKCQSAWWLRVPPKPVVSVPETGIPVVCAAHSYNAIISAAWCPAWCRAADHGTSLGSGLRA
jgi:hypothetical protein